MFSNWFSCIQEFEPPSIGMNIRAATIDDMPRIAKQGGDLGYPNDEESFPKRFLKIDSDPDHAVFVAELNSDEIAGWIHPKLGDCRACRIYKE